MLLGYCNRKKEVQTNKITTIHSLTGTTSSGGGSGGTEPKCFSRLSRSVNFIMITVLTHSFTDTKNLQLSANLLIIPCLCLSHTWSLMQVCKPLHEKHKFAIKKKENYEKQKFKN